MGKKCAEMGMNHETHVKLVVSMTGTSGDPISALKVTQVVQGHYKSCTILY